MDRGLACRFASRVISVIDNEKLGNPGRRKLRGTLWLRIERARGVRSRLSSSTNVNSFLSPVNVPFDELPRLYFREVSSPGLVNTFFLLSIHQTPRLNKREPCKNVSTIRETEKAFWIMVPMTIDGSAMNDFRKITRRFLKNCFALPSLFQWESFREKKQQKRGDVAILLCRQIHSGDLWRFNLNYFSSRNKGTCKL